MFLAVMRLKNLKFSVDINIKLHKAEKAHIFFERPPTFQEISDGIMTKKSIGQSNCGKTVKIWTFLFKLKTLNQLHFAEK